MTDNRFWNDTLEQADPEVYAAVRNELKRQQDKIELIARVRYHSKGYINLLQRNRAAHYMSHGVPPGWEGIQGL